MASGNKVAIIGAGPGGLAAALLLAKQGHDVHVYEQKSTVGGRNARLTLGDFHFDTGPTFFIYPPILEEVFEKSGLKLSDYVTLTPVNPLYALYLGNKIFRPSLDHEATKAQIATLFPGDEVGYQRYLTRNERRLKKVIPLLKKPFFRWWDFLSWDVMSSLVEIELGKSLYQHLKQYFSHPEMIYAMAFSAKYLGMSPKKAPSLFSILTYFEHGHGLFTVQGGLNAIAQGMQQAAQRLGVHFHFNTEVTKIDVEHRHVRELQFEDQPAESFDHVVMNADFGRGMQLIDEKHRPSYTNNKLNQKKFSCSTFMIYLGLDTLLPIDFHSILFPDDYFKTIQDIMDDGRLSDTPAIYVHNPSIQDETLAPKGQSALYILVPVPNLKANIDWHLEREQFAQKVLRVIESRMKVDLTSHIVAQKIIDPTHWRDDYNVHLGAVFNLSHSLDQMLIFRPHNRNQDIRNLYLVGGGTQPGSGLPTIYQSALIVADLIAKKKW